MNQNSNINAGVQALTRFNARFKPGTSTAMKSCVAALFLADKDNVFKYTNLIGLLQLDQDRKLKTKCLRLYNMDTMKLAFEVQLYYGFASYYQKMDDKFYYFPYPVGTVGLLFRNKQEADEMFKKIKIEAPTAEQQKKFIEQINAKIKKQQDSHSFFGMFKRKILGQQQVVEQSSQVQKVQKVYNIGIDANGAFCAQGLSPFTADILQRIGLSEKQKKNPQMMNMIANQLFIHQLKKQAIQNPQPQIFEIIKEHDKQQNEYLQECRQTKIMNIPPPPPPPPILSTQNRISYARMNAKANLMDEIRNNKIKLNHVQTNEKGGINLKLQSMDTVERDDFATALRMKVAMRKKALVKYNDSDDQN